MPWRACLWQRDSVSRVEYGSVSIDPIAETVMTVNVEFERPFEAIPWVSLEIKTSVPHRVWAGVQDRTATGFVLCLYRTNATNTVVHWRAEGK